MATIHSINLISSDPKIRGGRPCIAGTGLRVMDVALAKIAHGQEAEGIAQWYDLTLPQVYAALAYYYEHKKEIDADIREQMKIAREMKEKKIGNRHSLLP